MATAFVLKALGPLSDVVETATADASKALGPLSVVR
jgi:hypothetical protein